MYRVGQAASKSLQAARHFSALSGIPNTSSSYKGNGSGTGGYAAAGFVGALALTSFVASGKERPGDVEMNIDDDINLSLEEKQRKKFGDERYDKWLKDEERFLKLDSVRRKSVELRGHVTKKELVEVDQLFDNKRFTDCEDKLIELNTAIPNNDEILWRLARLKWEYAKSYDSIHNHTLYHLAHALAKRATIINPKNGNAHRWTALLVMLKGTKGGAKTSLEALEPMKYHLDRAIQINPKDSTAWTLLGNWHYEICEMGIIPSTYNRLFHGIVPPAASYDEALKCFETSAQIAREAGKKEWLKNTFFIARCYMRLGRGDDTLAIMERLSTIVIATHEDFRIKKEAHIILGKMKNPSLYDKLFNPMTHFRVRVPDHDVVNSFEPELLRNKYA